MAAEAARVLEFPDDYYSSAAPAGAGYARPAQEPVELPMAEERIRRRERERAAAAAVNVPAVSLFAIFGTLFAGVLMVFVLLAQISFSEIAGEASRLNAQFAELTEQRRRLEVTFESVIDMKEVERYARDELGMSKPEADQIAVIHSLPVDRIETFDSGEEAPLKDLGTFISSLFEYFKRS